MATSNRLKAWVRYDGQNKIVPSSLILRAKKPKVGTWVEIPTDLCCTTTTTTAYSINCTSWRYDGLPGEDTGTLLNAHLCGANSGCGDIDFGVGQVRCIQFFSGAYPDISGFTNLGPCTP